MFTKLLLAIFFSFAIASTSFAQQTAAGPIQNEDLRKLCIDRFAKSQYQSKITFRRAVDDVVVKHQLLTFNFDTAGVIRIDQKTQRSVCEVTMLYYDERFSGPKKPFLFEFDGIKAEEVYPNGMTSYPGGGYTRYIVQQNKSLLLERNTSDYGTRVNVSGILTRMK